MIDAMDRRRDAMIDVEFDAVIDPWPPFTFCCPQAIVDQDAEVSIPNISLPPLDEAPVHVPRFAACAPCDSQGSQCQCGIHRAEAASALRSRKTERAAKEKPTPISQFFFSTCCAVAARASRPSQAAGSPRGRVTRVLRSPFPPRAIKSFIFWGMREVYENPPVRGS